MNIIELKNISKKYNLNENRPLLIRSVIPGKKKTVTALRDITLSIKKGEVIGIIGANGSGKSTLLKLIAGITIPSRGKLNVNGRINSLIELGAGFHPDLTGRENIYLNGLLLGLTRKEIDEKIDTIIEFADIGNFLEQPVRTYSSGMAVRLGFSVAVQLDPEIMLIDEVLSVGDEDYQVKSFEKIEELRKNGKTIIFVSHNLPMVLSLCPKSIYLNSGKIEYIGNTKTAVSKYLSNINYRNKEKKTEVKNGVRWGSKEVEITGVNLLDASGKDKTVFNPSDPMIIRIAYRINNPKDTLTFGVSISSNGKIIWGTNSERDGVWFKSMAQEGSIEYAIKNLLLQPGKYSLSVAVRGITDEQMYDWHEGEYSFEIIPKSHLGRGTMFLEGTWKKGK